MGAGGSIMHAVKSLKANRALLKRKDKSSLSGSYSGLELKEFPKATPQQLKELRENLQKEKKRDKIN